MAITPATTAPTIGTNAATNVMIITGCDEPGPTTRSVIPIVTALGLDDAEDGGTLEIAAGGVPATSERSADHLTPLFGKGPDEAVEPAVSVLQQEERDDDRQERSGHQFDGEHRSPTRSTAAGTRHRTEAGPGLVAETVHVTARASNGESSTSQSATSSMPSLIVGPIWSASPAIEVPTPASTVPRAIRNPASAISAARPGRTPRLRIQRATGHSPRCHQPGHGARHRHDEQLTGEPHQRRHRQRHRQQPPGVGGELVRAAATPSGGVGRAERDGADDGTAVVTGIGEVLERVRRVRAPPRRRPMRCRARAGAQRDARREPPPLPRPRRRAGAGR